MNTKKILCNLFLIAAVLVTVSLSSCVKEDREDCTPEWIQTRVYFRDALDYGTRALDREDIFQVDLFVFNENGRFIKHFEDNDPYNDDDYFFEIDLEAGNYTFVTWFNFMEEYYGIDIDELIEDNTTYDELSMYLTKDEGDTVTKELHNLYFGSKKNSSIIKNRLNEVHIDIIRDTYVINVRTKGLPANDNRYKMKISDRNCNINFDNSLLTDQEVHYVRLFDKDKDGQLDGSLTVLRLREEHQNAVLKIKDMESDEFIFERNLIQMILGLRNKGVVVDFDRIFEYDILISFNADMSVTVNINGWAVIEDEHIIT